MKSRLTPNNILDTLFILAYSVGYVSLIKYITYAIFPIPESIQLFLFLSIIYLIRFGGKRVCGKKVSGNLVYLLIGLYFWELIQGLIVGGDVNGMLVIITNLCSTFVAFKYMSNIINTESTINPVINAYSVYMYYTLFIVIASSFLILSSILPPYSNQLGYNSLFKSNMETMNAVYYFPGYLSVVYRTPSIFLSRFDFPSLSGLSHESQAMYFTIYPAFFLLLYKSNKKNTERNILILFFLTTVLTTSLTAAISFIITYCLHLFWKIKVKGQYKSSLVILISIALVVIYVLTSQLNTIIGAFITEKADFDTVGSSGSDSLSMIQYVISPTGLLGQGIFSSTDDQRMQFSMNCGYISSIIIISFFIYYIYISIKNIFSEKLICHAIGLASFYFIAHSFKYGIQLFNSNYLFFIVFLLSYAEIMRKRTRQVEGNYKSVNKVVTAY